MGVDRFDGAELDYLKQILSTGTLAGSGAGFQGKLEKAFAEAYGVKHAVSANAAMSLLIAAAFAADAGAGDEVLCDPLVQFHAIGALWQNCVPTWADVYPDTWLMDPASARANITPQTKAMVVTNLWGQPAEVDTLRSLADEKNIVLIEDCAHAMFLPYKGKFAGTWGHIGIYSFCQGKHMTTGDGGMALTDDDELAAKLRGVTCFGESPPHLATVFRMTEMQAAIGLAQLEKVKGYIEEYNKAYVHLSAALDGCDWLQPRAIKDGCGNSPYIFSFLYRGDERDLDQMAFQQALFDTGDLWNIGFTQVPAYKYKLFTQPLAYQNKGCPKHNCPYYEGSYEYRDGLCPNAEALLPRLVNTNCMISEENARRVAEGLRKAIEQTEKG
ncbi:MAG: DegT/DnrJ/EryC1/StrS family aminotransferase [Armatimonadota bacterium]